MPQSWSSPVHPGSSPADPEKLPYCLLTCPIRAGNPPEEPWTTTATLGICPAERRSPTPARSGERSFKKMSQGRLTCRNATLC